MREYFSNSSNLENNPTAVISKENAKEETKDIDIIIDSNANVEDPGYIQDLKSECKSISIYELKSLLQKELSYTDEHNNSMQDLSNSFLQNDDEKTRWRYFKNKDFILSKIELLMMCLWAYFKYRLWWRARSMHKQYISWSKPNFINSQEKSTAQLHREIVNLSIDKGTSAKHWRSVLWLQIEQLNN